MCIYGCVRWSSLLAIVTGVCPVFVVVLDHLEEMLSLRQTQKTLNCILKMEFKRSFCLLNLMGFSTQLTIWLITIKTWFQIFSISLKPYLLLLNKQQSNLEFGKKHL